MLVELTQEQKDLVTNLAIGLVNMDKEMKRLRDIEGEEGQTISAILEALEKEPNMEGVGFDS